MGTFMYLKNVEDNHDVKSTQSKYRVEQGTVDIVEGRKVLKGTSMQKRFNYN